MSTQILVNQLKDKMSQGGLTAYSLERKAGLKSNAVHNILSGRSKNPSIHIILCIAKALNCSVSDLIGEEIHSFALQGHEIKLLPSNTDIIENDALYLNSLSHFINLLNKQGLLLKKEQILKCVDEIYLYSNKKGLNKVDTHFALWIFEKAHL